VYSFFRLRGKGNKTIDEVFERGTLMILDSVGAMIHVAIPSFTLITSYDVGIYQRLGIIFLLILFCSIVLYFILKVTKGRKRNRRGLIFIKWKNPFGKWNLTAK
jgi:hypothetical protein